MIIFGFLGGLILNGMPCVLPVLSVKIFALFKYKGSQSKDVRFSSAMVLLGILVSVELLAVAVIVTRALGHAVGWGFQFQEPGFVALLAALMVVFAANLWGWVEFQLPARIRTYETVHFHHPLLEDFFHGVLMTLMATPCSAPFLGTAVSFSLANDASAILLVFSAVGLGLGTPYGLLALFPGWIGWLPKPGRWMGGLKIFFGMLMAISAVWLMWILKMQIHLLLWMSLWGLTAVLLAGLFLKRNSKTSLRAPAIVLYLGLCLGLSLWPGFTEPSSTAHGKASSSRIVWHPFDINEIQRQVTQNRVVFVDVTADWCVTCKVNESVIFNTRGFQDLVHRYNVFLVKADWTNPNPAVSEFLQSFERYAIPFYVVYGPSAPHGKPLPDLVTLRVIKDAIQSVSVGTQ
jgi:suppressor for copper-sensitivity B